MTARLNTGAVSSTAAGLSNGLSTRHLLAWADCEPTQCRCPQKILFAPARDMMHLQAQLMTQHMQQNARLQGQYGICPPFFSGST